MPCEQEYNNKSDHISNLTDADAQIQLDTAYESAARGHSLRDRMLVVCGFVLMPLAAVALLAGVVYLFRIVEPLPYGPAISAAASAVAMYIILKLLKALFVCL